MRLNSFRYLPAELSILPIVIVALSTSWLLSLRGWPWIFAYGCTLLISLLGALFLFRAKLPLYRKHHFLTVGTRELSPASLPLYRRGLLLSAIGIFLSLLLILTSQRGF